MENKFLKAANWAFRAEQAGENVGIIIKRMPYDDQYSVTLLNAHKSLLYEGYSHEEQTFLKGLIVREHLPSHTADTVVAYCFPKFYNLGELQ